MINMLGANTSLGSQRCSASSGEALVKTAIELMGDSVACCATCRSQLAGDQRDCGKWIASKNSASPWLLQKSGTADPVARAGGHAPGTSRSNVVGYRRRTGGRADSTARPG